MERGKDIFLIKGKKYLVNEKRICNFAPPKRNTEIKESTEEKGNVGNDRQESSFKV